jgi:hypothetical protein
MNEFGREVFWIILGGWIGKICPRLRTLFFVITTVIN